MSTTAHVGKTIENLTFDNKALRSLPLDEEKRNFIRTVPGACFSLVVPTPVENPRLICVSPSALALLDLEATEANKQEFAEYFSGNKLIPGSQPAAACYCGHQFGYFSGQLGDGAAMYLGEVINSKGERIELQLKGAGKTPYSRTADGRKVLRSSLREFLCSEAMHFLGVPTTRSATVVTSDTMVVRDVLYTGNPIEERATVITRLAPSFLRFGSFEIVKPRDPVTGREGPSTGRVDVLRSLLDYTIETFFPHIWNKHLGDAARGSGESEGKGEIEAAALTAARQAAYLEFYEEVVIRTARLVAHWQSIGFCHGVLNTDNMSILGLTLDYGPFGFMERYDPGFICNASDEHGRYAYQSQPGVCKWNLEKLAEALQPLLPLDLSKPRLQQLWDAEFRSAYMQRMRAKLGLRSEQEGDERLILALFDTMEKTGADFTNTFRALSRVRVTAPPAASGAAAADEKGDSSGGSDPALQLLVEQCASLQQMRKALRPRIPAQELVHLMFLAQHNPGMLQELSGPEEAAFLMSQLALVSRAQALRGLTEASKREADRQAWAGWLSAYRARLAAELQGLPEEARRDAEEERAAAMDAVNPARILRNWIAQEAIAAAEKGDYTVAERVLAALSKPFEEPEGGITKQLPPDWALDLCVT